MTAWEVFLGSKWIDTVFFDNSCTHDEVRTSLINHDGYPVGIEINRPR